MVVYCCALTVFALAADPQPAQAAAQPFCLSEIRLLDGPFLDSRRRLAVFLRATDPDRLLHNFRQTAGLPSIAEPLGGWEKPTGELRGHSMGHYLSGCSLMYAATGEAFWKQRVDYMVAELAKCQAAMPSRGYNAGFLSAYPESFFDRVDQCKPVWAPYYTLHKILAGLLDAHDQCGNGQALEVLQRMADWLGFRVGRLSVEAMQKSLKNEHGGMNEALANLYAITRKPEHLRLSQAFNHQVIFVPLAAGEDKLDGLHANTQIPKIIGAARQYELTGDPAMATVARTFWDRVALHRSYCIGGHSDCEHFFPVDQFAKHLSPQTAETCNTYNMLKLTRHLFAWEPSATLMDFYERGLFNQILASQDPEKGMMIYFASLKPGHFKVYNRPEDSFWCCTGTGMENHAKYGDTTYFRSADTLFVNLFMASEVAWKQKGVTLRQETRFPEDGAVRLTLQCAAPSEFALAIRHPGWAAALPISINGQPQANGSKPGSYVTLRRTWQSGDRVELQLPLELRTELLPGAAEKVAILYGPIVLAGRLGTEGMPNPYARDQNELNSVPAPDVPVLRGTLAEVLKHIEPVSGQSLAFATHGIGSPSDVTLIPYYRLHGQRLNIYWDVLDDAGWQRRLADEARQAAQRKAYEARIVDAVESGDTASEKSHAVAGENSRTGRLQDRTWRDAAAGGWFSYRLAVRPGVAQVLECTYWGSDTGKRKFDLVVDGRTIATQELKKSKPGHFFTVEYPLPAELLEGKQAVTVKFASRDQSLVGGLFGVKILVRSP